MDDQFKIYVEQLREGQERRIDESLDPSFMEIEEPALVFKNPIIVKGKTYLAEKELVIHWNIDAEAFIPCSICNDMTAIPIHLKNIYHTEPVDEIKGGIFNFKELLRTTILLETPAFVECHDGHCPQRKELEKFIKQASDHEAEGQKPFADLDL